MVWAAIPRSFSRVSMAMAVDVCPHPVETVMISVFIVSPHRRQRRSAVCPAMGRMSSFFSLPQIHRLRLYPL